MSGRKAVVLCGLLALVMVAAVGCASTPKTVLPYATARDLDLKGNYADALPLYQKQIDTPDSSIKDMAMFRMGRCYYELGQTDKAVATFKQVIATYPNSKWAKEAQTELDYVAKYPKPIKAAVAETKPAAAKPAPEKKAAPAQK